MEVAPSHLSDTKEFELRTRSLFTTEMDRWWRGRSRILPQVGSGTGSGTSLGQTSSGLAYCWPVVLSVSRPCHQCFSLISTFDPEIIFIHVWQQPELESSSAFSTRTVHLIIASPHQYYAKFSSCREGYTHLFDILRTKPIPSKFVFSVAGYLVWRENTRFNPRTVGVRCFWPSKQRMMQKK